MDANNQGGMTCPITGCPIKKVLIATVVAGLVTFVYDWFVHGVLLKADYAATAALWRPMADMEAMWQVCVIYHVVLAFGVAGLYCFMGQKSDCGGSCTKMGATFGLLLGLIMGITHFSSYIWLPMPLGLALKWLAAGVIWGVLIGFVLSRFCTTCAKKA